MYFIWGFIFTRPGRREAFLDIMVAYAEACRQEQGCVYFEIAPSPTGPDTLILAECWASRDDHHAHELQPRFAENQAQVRQFCIGVKLNKVDAETPEYIDLRWD